MNDILDDYSAPSLITANRANLFAFYEYLASSTAPNVELHDDGEFRWFISGLSYAFVNNVLRTQLNSDNVDRRIEETIAHFKSKGVNSFTWWVESGTRPENLPEHLKAHGLTYSEGPPCMAVDLQQLNEDLPAPAGLEIKKVADEKMLRDWVNASLIGFGDLEARESDPCFDMFIGLGFDLPLRNYVAYLDGRPVAVSQLFLGGGVAGLYWVATIAEARGQGVGAAVSLAPLIDARKMGYRIGILQASPMGAPVYKRMGFQEYSRLSSYVYSG